MKWLNDTSHAADVFRTELGDNEMVASVLVRVRYRLTAAGELLLDADERLPDLRRDRIDTRFGALEPDGPHPRTGTDVIVLAEARASPGDQRYAAVELRAPSYQLRLVVFGERRWQRQLGKLVASVPEPFQTIPLTWANAFGGHARIESQTLALPNAYNPDGKGYYLDARAAVDQPLPNIEDADALIRNWDDHPKPIGWGPYPRNWGLAIEQIYRLDSLPGEKPRYKLCPESMFDRAHPRLSGARLSPNDDITISGTTFASQLAVRLPAAPVLLQIELGDTTLRRDFQIEEVVLDLVEGFVDVGYRKIIRYEFISHQARRLTLLENPGG